jgi:type IV secretory pathway TraG/TraD family ATPase VirD4
MGRLPCPMNIGRYRFPKIDPKRRNRISWPIFSISDEQRMKHMLVIGKTGTGKSTALENQIIQDIRAGRGVAVFDPHGHLVDRVLELVPRNRWNHVVLFDPSDRQHPIGFNILDRIEPDRRPFVASSVVDIFRASWKHSWGPQLEMFLYAGTAALLDMPDATLLGLKFLMTSPRYRKKVIRQIKDPLVLDFWKTDFQKHMPEKEQRERTLSTLNKIGQLVTDPTIRNVIGQPRTKLSFSQIMSDRNIFLARLPQGELGIQKSSLVGSLLISALHLAALQRSTSAKPFHVYVDEFHNFHGFEEMLSGIRKFGVSLTLCHQYLDQLDPELQKAILGTVGTMMVFQIGGNDAESIKTTLRVRAEELTALEPHEAFVATGSRTTHLRMERPITKSVPRAPVKIRNRCRNQLAVPRIAVEGRIERFKRGT